MKNVLKAFGNLNRARSAMVPLLIIAIVAVIGFSFAACGGDDDNGGGGGGGNTIASGAEVIYDSRITNLAEAKRATNFGFGVNMYSSNREIEPLSNFLDGSSSVTVNDSKINIILGTPKSNYLQNFGFGGGVTVKPSNAKFFQFPLPCFFTSDVKYGLGCGTEDMSNGAYLYYVDRDVTAKGTVTDKDGETRTINISLKKGWQYTIQGNDEVSASTKLPSGFKWIVIEYGYRE
jgi:hypothetical protein